MPMIWVPEDAVKPPSYPNFCNNRWAPCVQIAYGQLWDVFECKLFLQWLDQLGVSQMGLNFQSELWTHYYTEEIHLKIIDE